MRKDKEAVANLWSLSGVGPTSSDGGSYTLFPKGEKKCPERKLRATSFFFPRKKNIEISFRGSLSSGVILPLN
jgi:hypothetical protein